MIIKKARILQPHFTEPIFAIACINIELGNYNQAIEYYEIVIGEKKDDKKLMLILEFLTI